MCRVKPQPISPCVSPLQISAPHNKYAVLCINNFTKLKISSHCIDEH